MKLTKSYLKQIVKEELYKLKEQSTTIGDPRKVGGDSYDPMGSTSIGDPQKVGGDDWAESRAGQIHNEIVEIVSKFEKMHKASANIYKQMRLLTKKMAERG